MTPPKEWRPSPGWRVVDAAESDRYGCRWGAGPRTEACGARPVAAMRRTHGPDTRWWHYCSEHLYGGRIVDGAVCHLAPTGLP